MQDIISKLTIKDDKYACAIADIVIAESLDTDEWYEHFDAFTSLLRHPKSLVRNRGLHILAANVQWMMIIVLMRFFRNFFPTSRMKNLLQPDNASRHWHRWDVQNRSSYQGS